MILKLSTALVIALICSSCARDFKIEPTGFGTSVQLTFYNSGIVSRGGEAFDFAIAPCISELIVTEESIQNGRGRIAWQISANDSCVTLQEIDVGQTPQGFVETVSNIPLRSGQIYRATARSNEATGNSLPWLVCSNSAVALQGRKNRWLEGNRGRCSR